MATIEPSPRSTISRAYACATMNVPKVLTDRIRSNSSRVISSDGTGLKIPATSATLSASRVRSTSDAIDASSRRSTATASTS